MQLFLFMWGSRKFAHPPSWQIPKFSLHHAFPPLGGQHTTTSHETSDDSSTAFHTVIVVIIYLHNITHGVMLSICISMVPNAPQHFHSVLQKKAIPGLATKCLDPGKNTVAFWPWSHFLQLPKHHWGVVSWKGMMPFKIIWLHCLEKNWQCNNQNSKNKRERIDNCSEYTFCCDPTTSKMMHQHWPCVIARVCRVRVSCKEPVCLCVVYILGYM